MNSSIFLTFLVIATTVQIGSGLQCYFCSPNDPACTDPFVSGSVGTIEFSCTFCTKIKSETDGVQSIARSCGTTPTYENKCVSSTINGVSTMSCNCDTNLCNTGSMALVSMAAIVMCVIFAKIL